MHDPLRQLTPGDKPAYLRLMAQAFERGAVAKESDAVWDEAFGSETMGIFADEQLRAAVTVRPFTLHFKNATARTLPMGGIAGVATATEARGRGYVDRLLRDALVRMRGAGQVMSALYPFAWAFYRKFGWEWVGEKRTITVPLREIKAAPESRFVRELSADAAQTLAVVYDRYAAKYHGAFTSESHQWADKLRHDDGRTTFVYAYFPEGGDAPTAYLLWRYDGSGADGGEVREFVAYTPDGYRALFGLLHQLGTQCRTARLSTPADAHVWHMLYHWGIETKTEPVFQARVVDVCAAVSALAAPHGLPDGASVSLQISDDAAPWNNGVFHASVENGHVRCHPALDLGAADISLDIQALSQAFWGSPALPVLRDAGRIQVFHEPGYETLAALLPATPVYTMDFF